MTRMLLSNTGQPGSNEEWNTSDAFEKKWMLKQNNRQTNRQRTEGKSVQKGRDVRTHRTLGASPAGPRTRVAQVEAPPVEAPRQEGLALRQTPQGTAWGTDEIVLGPQSEPTLVVPHRQAVDHYQEEIRRLRTPPTTQATPEARAATSRI